MSHFRHFSRDSFGGSRDTNGLYVTLLYSHYSQVQQEETAQQLTWWTLSPRMPLSAVNRSGRVRLRGGRAEWLKMVDWIEVGPPVIGIEEPLKLGSCFMISADLWSWEMLDANFPSCLYAVKLYRPSILKK